MSSPKNNLTLDPGRIIFVDYVATTMQQITGIPEYAMGAARETSEEWAERLFREYLEYEHDNKT